jgi:hypothetical protein
MWMSMRQNRMDGLLDTNWRTHFSSDSAHSGKADVASKTVIEQIPAGDGGRLSDVQVEQETLRDYFEEEVYQQTLLISS